MFLRNVLFAVGAAFVLLGGGLFVVWLGQARNRPAAVESHVEKKTEILTAARAIPVGTLLRTEDMKWKEVNAGAIHPGTLLRGQVAEAEFVGAISRRSFAAGEVLIASEFIKPNERRFLAAVLKPGRRAISIAVDAAQSVAGLVLPGDQVDVILTQSFGDNVTDPGRKAVAETVLRNVRVIAVDQSLNTQRISTTDRGVIGSESRIPKTVTLELRESQAETLMVAAQIGKFQLAVRPIEATPALEDARKPNSRPIWASDVSLALTEMKPRQHGVLASASSEKCNPVEAGTGSTLESSIRRPPTSCVARMDVARPAIVPTNVEKGLQ
ncbi:MAG: Flp pilus assembly protein CpaB [Methylovirgula sp.]